MYPVLGSGIWNFAESKVLLFKIGLEDLVSRQPWFPIKFWNKINTIITKRRRTVYEKSSLHICLMLLYMCQPAGAK